MKKHHVISKATLAMLLTTGLVGSASGDSYAILGGALAASQNAVDVFRTTCFSWGDGVHPPAVYSGQNNGHADRFKFAISLTAGNTVTATVGYTRPGNVNGNAAGNNVLPASPAPATQTASDTSLGTAWDVNSAPPQFGSTAPYFSPSPFGITKSLIPNGAGGNANGEYVIVISHGDWTATGYDFIGSCQNGADWWYGGTGMGIWFYGTPPNVVPYFPYDQVIDQ